MLFHRLQAWNLAYALYDDRKLAAQSNPFIAHRFDEGFRQGWIGPALWREALEMFVLDDTPLLPPDLDIDPRPIKDHLYWFPHVAPDLGVRPMGRYRLAEIRALRGLILANLNTRGVALSASDFDTITHNLEKMPEGIRWAASGPELHEIELEFTMASLSLELARRGIPTYTHLPTGFVGAASAPAAPRTDDIMIAKFYFENQIQVPSPPSFSAALRLRENPRIQDWRAKVRSWSEKLKSGATGFAEIKQAIDDANGYIQGANLPLRLVPRWSSIVTLPFAYYHTFLSHNELGHIVGICLFAYEVFNLYGELIAGAVKAPNPLEYKWFLVSNNG